MRFSATLPRFFDNPPTGFMWNAPGALGGMTLVILALAVGLWADPGGGSPAPVINDVTGLNPIPVARVVRPAAVDEVVRALRETRGPVSIGGGRFSMGGQVAHEGSLHLDMTGMDRVLAIDIPGRKIRVQAGARWQKVQAAIDPHDLSVRIMQTYANFTVGGSLSVNVHGRYMGEGPIIKSVESIKLVLADGTVVTASPRENPGLFYGAIGGYGGLGVIVEAELTLASNARVTRVAKAMGLTDYPGYFSEQIRGNRKVVFHNADLYPNGYDRVMAVSWEETDRPLTETRRLQDHGPTTSWERARITLLSEVPFVKDFRRILFDPLLYRGERVVMRNFEAGYDVAELEPASREKSTYVLQEYFVPAGALLDFIPRMAATFHRHGVNVLNVSIRHAWGDPGSTLAWARGETFALVVYYKQGTSTADRYQVGTWTRELVDHVLACGGTYYLPYQPHATVAQFHAAYPGAPTFFALKQKVDPGNRFRNRLWDAYYRPGVPPGHLARRDLPHRTGWSRREDQSFLTLPEWFIVFSYEEYANHLARDNPSAFPYFRSIKQFWGRYGDVTGHVRGRYPWNGGAHLMNLVISASFSVEYAIKGLYEVSLGRFSEWVSRGKPTSAEDAFLARTAADYLAFIRERPWYEFSFLGRVAPLWALPDQRGFRGWERRLSATAEFLVKALWAQVITWGSRATYEAEPKVTPVLLDPRGVPLSHKAIPVDGSLALVDLPRYEAITPAARDLLDKGVRFHEICGNRIVMVTFLAPRTWVPPSGTTVVSRWPILTREGFDRVALGLPVGTLGESLRELGQAGLVLDHVFDY